MNCHEETSEFTAYIDGACRGNPGPGALGVVIYNNRGEVIVRLKETLGPCTNNVAEYKALIKALETACQLKIDRLKIKSDSQLLVRQLNREYKVKDEKIRALFVKATSLLENFKKVDFYHILRSENAIADSLANEILDGK